MTRKVGSFIDPKTGEEHWLEPETVKDYPLPNQRLAQLGESEYKTVEFVLSSNGTDRTIELLAKVQSNDDWIIGKKVSMNETRFAELLFESYVEEHTFSTKEEIVAFQDQAMDKMREEAFNRDVIFNHLKLSGYGTVLYDKDIVGVFDNIEISSTIHNSETTIKIKNLVSNTTIVDDKNPTIQFVLPNGKLMLAKSLTVSEHTSALLSEYTFKTSDAIEIGTGDYIAIPSVSEKDTEESDSIKERIAMLASAALDENNIDDRFDDIFDF